MRILHVVHQYLPEHVAGTELYTQMVAEAQAAAGHDVSLFVPTTREGHDPTNPLVERGVTVFRISCPAGSAAAVFARTFRQPELAAAFAAVVTAIQPDIVNIQHMMGLPVAMLDSLHDRGIPYALTLHDYWYPCANAQLITNYDGTLCAGPDARHENCARCALARAGVGSAAPLLAGVAPLMRRRARLLQALFAEAAIVFAPTPFVRDLYAELGYVSDRVIVRPKGLDRPPELERSLQEWRLRAPGAPLHVGYLGSLSPQKGVHVLIEAVNRLVDEPIRLTIYGDPTVMPEYVAELRAMARHPGISFAGPVMRGAVWETLARMDVLVVPSLWYEAAPTTIREAFAVGLPVVASDLGTMPDLVVDGVNGRLFPPGDTESLAEMLQSFVRKREQLERLASGVKPDRSMQAHVADLLTAYQQVLGAESGPAT